MICYAYVIYINYIYLYVYCVFFLFNNMCIPSFQVPRVLLKSAIVTAPNEPSDTQEELQLASEGDLFAEVEKMICAMAVDGSTDLKGGTLKKAHFIGNK